VSIGGLLQAFEKLAEKENPFSYPIHFLNPG
jgi:hypothetical protein